MQLVNAMCYILLTITVTASCLQGETQKQLSETKPERHITKRDTKIFIENSPPAMYSKQAQKVIYRRISKPNNRKPRPKYGPPRPKYGPPHPSKERNKKYSASMKKYHGKHIKSKYIPSSHRFNSKLRYRPPKNSRIKTINSIPNHFPHKTYYPPEPIGFGEPPTQDVQIFKPSRPINNDVPVDSYGAPLKSSVININPNAEDSDGTKYFHNHEYSFKQEPNNWRDSQQETGVDNSYAYSKKRPTYASPDLGNDIYKHEAKKPRYSLSVLQYMEQQRKKTEKNLDADDHILVGGQYAEPPARYVPKVQPTVSMYFKNEDLIAPQHYVDSDVAASANVSSYVNYKHSNMAFSPQNLNDAFSIVDK